MEKNADLLLSELEAVYATAPIGLGLMDCDLRFVRLNAHLAEINGLPVEAHLGRTGADRAGGVRRNTAPTARAAR